ncbi:MAG: aminotransferase class V-fold PLP-dependent enzyme [Chloroflexota bacterium]
MAGYTPEEVATHLGKQGIFVWHGHYYAVAVMERLGLLDKGGLVRIGFCHYNTPAEVDAVLAALTRWLHWPQKSKVGLGAHYMPCQQAVRHGINIGHNIDQFTISSCCSFAACKPDAAGYSSGRSPRRCRCVGRTNAAAGWRLQ